MCELIRMASSTPAIEQKQIPKAEPQGSCFAAGDASAASALGSGCWRQVHPLDLGRNLKLLELHYLSHRNPRVALEACWERANAWKKCLRWAFCKGSVRMTTHEHTLLNHYNITTLFPTAWPAEKDESDASEDEQLRSKPQTGRLAHQRSNSRYSVLARSTSDRRSLVPGSEKTGDGLENLVQKDEPDPLGGPDSVVRILRHKGLPVEEDQRLREGT